MEKELSFSLEEVREKLALLIGRQGGNFESAMDGEREFQIVAVFPGQGGRIFLRATESAKAYIRGSLALPRTLLKIEPGNLPRSFLDDFFRDLDYAFLRGGG